MSRFRRSGIVLHPRAVRGRAAHQHHGRDGGHPDYLPEEVDDVLRPLQGVEVAVQDDAIPGGGGELDVLAQQFGSSVHRPVLLWRTG